MLHYNKDQSLGLTRRNVFFVHMYDKSGRGLSSLYDGKEELGLFELGMF